MKYLIITLVICLVILVLLNSKIDLREYPETIDYGILSDYEREVVDSILTAVNHHEDTVYNTPLTILERQHIRTHLGLYYGSMNDVGSMFVQLNNDLRLNLELFYQLEHNKAVIDFKVDDIVQSMYKGTDKFKLLQISKYIADTVTYSKGDYSTIDALNGKGVCAEYTMLFYKLATRLGIQTYYCHNENHAWNMVEINGEQYFYDVTWFDTPIPNYKYIGSRTSWDRNYIINNAWY